MKLVLANNQTPKFVQFYKELQADSPTPFVYSSYNSLLFYFDTSAEQKVEVYNLAENQPLTDYDGIYINGYMYSVELATSLATCAGALGIPYVNQELSNAPSLSKLSAHAKLAKANVSTPKTFGGAKAAIVQAGKFMDRLQFPAILKRADADRGIDNFKVKSFEEVLELLEHYEDNSIWILQEYIDNNGYYLMSFYDSKPSFCIFRSLAVRPDLDERKAHMYKPKGGSNASLIDLHEVPKTIMTTCQAALDIMNRQIGSVDCIYVPETDKAFILEVNYNPQLVTIETFKDVRVKAFLENLAKLK